MVVVHELQIPSPDTGEVPVENVEGEPFDDEWIDVLGSGDLMIKILKEDKSSKRPERGKTVTFNVSTSLADNDKVVEEFKNKEIILGDSDVIQGLDMILTLMRVGETYECRFAPKLAYGKIGCPPNIPPDSKLKCIVELLSMADTPDEDTLEFEQRIKLGEIKKKKGNFWYSIQDYTQALHCYRRSLDYFDNDGTGLTGSEEELQQLLEERLKVHNNMAAAQIKINAFDAAAKSLDFVLRAQPTNVKALFRKGKVYAGNEKIDEAIKIMKAALKLEPESKVIHNELAKLTKQKNRERSNEKEMYRKMLGQDKIVVDKPSHFGKWSYVAGAVAAVALSYIAAKNFLLSANI